MQRKPQAVSETSHTYMQANAGFRCSKVPGAVFSALLPATSGPARSDLAKLSASWVVAWYTLLEAIMPAQQHRCTTVASCCI